MNKFVTTISAVSLVITFFLLSSAHKHDFHHRDALSFEAPHLQRNELRPRRNLSEAGDATNKQLEERFVKSNDRIIESMKDEEAKKLVKPNWGMKEPDKQPENPERRDNRPSGVVYEYIPPPPINMTARSLLATQFPHLANLNATTTSTALCGIVRDAEAYLDEWVDYYFGLGVHTIYLIDNSEDHELLEWQNKRRNAGYSVRVMPKPGRHRQMYGYHMCVQEHKDDHTYMAFFDVDEFLVLKKHDTIDQMLKQHLPKGSLAISWHIFGTGTTRAYSPLPVTKRFMYRDGVTTRDRHEQWNTVKSILKLADYGGYPKTPHSMKTNRRNTGSDKSWLDTNGKGTFDSIGSQNDDRPLDVAVIHHYKYLSRKEFTWKTCIRKTVDDKYKDCDAAKKKNIFAGTVFDDSAWQFFKKNVPKYALFDGFEDFM